MINGSTYSFTVDTPEYQGSVSANIGTKGLYTQIRSSDGATQKYQISDAADVKKEEGPLLSGDRLTVISEDGKSKQVYYVLVKELAIAGKLELGTEKMTVHTPQQLSLYFTARQLSPDATVSITVPAGIRLTIKKQLLM